MLLLQDGGPRRAMVRQVSPLRLRLGEVPRLAMPERKAMSADYQRSKAQIRRSLLRAIEHHAQLRRDIESWNENRTDAPPFDAGGDLVAEQLARKMLAYVEVDQPVPDALFARYREQCKANAKK